MPDLSTARYRTITINLTRDQYIRLQQQAVQRTTSISQLLRELLLVTLQTEAGSETVRPALPLLATSGTSGWSRSSRKRHGRKSAG